MSLLLCILFLTLVSGCVSFFCAACLLGRGGRVEPRGGTLAKRKGVVPRVKKREKPKMQPEDLQERWKAQGEETFATVAQWRAAHPQATLAEIEQAVDEQCGQPLQARGRARRRWQTQGGQQVEVERTYVTCPQCGGGFFPPG